MNVRRITLLAALAVAVSIAVSPEGQAGGGVTPISICDQIVTTNAYLVSSLDCEPNTPGVIIGADGITVDLKGFTIRGDRSSLRYGIDNSGAHDGVTIKNGVLRNFDYGVVTYGDKVSLSNIVASGNVNAGIYVSGESPSLKSSTASGNTGSGIVVASGPSAKITSAAASGNGEDGIFIGGASASVKSSTASGNGFFGIEVVADTAKIVSSTVSGNADGGIAVDGNAAQLKGNHAEANGFDGGASNAVGLGLSAVGYTIAPVGTNVSRGNDDPAECSPALLC